MCRETEATAGSTSRARWSKYVSKRAYFTPLAFRRVRTLTVNHSWIKLDFRSTMKLLKALSDFRS